MAISVEKLYEAFPDLQTKWNGVVEFSNVTEVDNFYSDGISKNALVKIILRYPGESTKYNVVYVYPSGGYSNIFERPVNHTIAAWMAGILKKKD